jgi:hypothetical protein
MSKFNRGLFKVKRKHVHLDHPSFREWWESGEKAGAEVILSGFLYGKQYQSSQMNIICPNLKFYQSTHSPYACQFFQVRRTFFSSLFLPSVWSPTGFWPCWFHTLSWLIYLVFLRQGLTL